MKKFFLSLTVILSFIIYSLQQKLTAPVESIVTPVVDNSEQPSIEPIAQSTQPINRQYKDGGFIGEVADAFFGNLQVKVIITDGKISDVVFLQYPDDRPTSVLINTRSNPVLKQEAIIAQSAEVDIVSGATQSSEAFIKSLQSALDQAKT